MELLDEFVLDPDAEIVVVCRRGNSSQEAVRKLKSRFGDRVQIRDVAGGLQAWSKEVDPSFPIY